MIGGQWFCLVICCLCCVCSTIEGQSTTEVYDLDKPAPTHSASGVAGRPGWIPCDAGSRVGDQLLVIVLWFREDGEPVYSYDVRNRSPSHPRLWSSPKAFGTRAIFRPGTTSPGLLVDPVEKADAGLYRCRVDFKDSPTVNVKINFTVITLPSRPAIRNAQGEVLTSLVQTYNEGDTVDLHCQTEGGDPPPDITWYLENTPLPSRPVPSPRPDVISRHVTLQVGRRDRDARLVCEARNTDLAPARQRVLVLDVRLKPLTVKIANKTHVSADRPVFLQCNSTGSRPDAVLSWWKNGRPMKNVQNTVVNGTSLSVLTLTPEAEDHGALLLCRAENTALDVSIQDFWTMDVRYAPILSLRLSSKIKPSEVKEGSDVFFECNVRANPKATNIYWSFNNKEIFHNLRLGILVSNHTLLLQRVSRSQAGDYSCSADNEEGTGTSNIVHLDVKYPPKCKQSEEVVVGAVNNETVRLHCEVDSNPESVNFTWYYGDLSRRTEIPPGYYNSNGSLSILNYTPESESGFGSILCLVSNPVSDQLALCTFKVIYADRPSPLENCSIVHNGSKPISLVCDAGFDGGMPQMFHAEVYSLAKLEVLSNMTASTSPVFNISYLDSDLRYLFKVYASNAKGKSEVVRVHSVVTGPLERYFEDDESSTSTTLSRTLVVIISLSVLVVSAFCITVAAQYWRRTVENADNVKMIPVSNILFEGRGGSSRTINSNTYCPSPKPEYPASCQLSRGARGAGRGARGAGRGARGAGRGARGEGRARGGRHCDDDPDVIPCRCANQDQAEYDSLQSMCDAQDHLRTYDESIGHVSRGVTARGSDISRARQEAAVVVTVAAIQESCI